MASFELGQMLGRREVISKLEMSWHELCEHGDEPFDLPFLPIRGVQPCLTLKVAVVQTRGNPLLHVRSEPAGHPRRAIALTNLAWARLQGHILKDLQGIDSTISLFREALALRPQRHPDRPFYVYNLTEALTRRPSTAASINETAQLYYELLPLCPEGTYLQSIALGDNRVGYVIRECNNLPINVSDEGIHLRRVVLELCQLGHQCPLDALTMLAEAIEVRFVECGSIDDIDESTRSILRCMKPSELRIYVHQTRRWGSAVQVSSSDVF